jgi:hypothetical protein
MTSPQVRKVIDSNYLQCDTFREYLSKSSQHFAVLPDYVAMEAYKADTLEILYRSMEILSKYPKRVLVLKSTQTVCGLSGREAGLQKRLIDQKQTRGFAEYLKHLIAARAGNRFLQMQLLDHARQAKLQMDRILSDAQDFGGALEGMEQQFERGQVQIIRKGLPYTEEMRSTFIQHVLMIAASMFRSHPRVTQLPNVVDLRNTFIFRVALCTYLLGHRWIAVGGAKQVKATRIRNDLIDVILATYATYFDGLLSADKKVNSIHNEARWLLANVFVRPNKEEFQKIMGRNASSFQSSFERSNG